MLLLIITLAGLLLLLIGLLIGHDPDLRRWNYDYALWCYQYDYL